MAPRHALHSLHSATGKPGGRHFSMLLLSMLLAVCSAALADIEEQYNQIFDDHNATLTGSEPTACISLQQDIGIADGSFIMPSLGQVEMGSMQMVGLFDAFRQAVTLYRQRRARLLCSAHDGDGLVECLARRGQSRPCAALLRDRATTRV